MCLTVLMVNPDAEEGGYRLIMAFNRDEFYSRPTKAAGFWEQDPNMISGLDMFAGKEGGTWLGMSRSGRLAMLLNILQPGGVDPDAKGRGLLVSNFLKGTMDGQSYLKEVAKERDLYNGFNLVTIELSKNGGADMNYYTNRSEEPVTMKPGIYAFSNHTFSASWPKTDFVRTAFERIVSQSHQLTKDELASELFTLMAREKPLVSSPSLLSEMKNMDLAHFAASLKELVFISSETYGTRTTTLILVDAAGEVTFTEKTLREPISTENRVWDQTSHTFSML